MAKTTKNKIPGLQKGKLPALPDRLFPIPIPRFKLLLVVLTLVCYVNTLGHDFALDDGIVITKNIYTQQGIRGIPDILTHDTFQGFFQGEQKQLVAGGRYRPLSLVLFAVEKSLIGERPWFYHLINILLYVLAVLLVFQFTLVALSRWYTPEQTKWIAGFTAVFFAVHPLHTEVVANIKGGDEILSFLFGMASIYFLWRPSTHWKFKGYSIGLFTLALFSKENAILWLPLGWLAFYFLDKKTWLAALKKIVPLFVPASAFLLVRYLVLHQMTPAPLALEWLNNPFLKIIQNKYAYCTESEKWGSIIYSLIHYLRMNVWPYPLTHDYFPNHFPLRSMSEPGVILALFLLLSLFLLAWIQRIKKPVLSFCIFFFFGSLILVSNIFFPVGILISERFAFTASFGYCLFMAWWLAPHWTASNKLVKVFVVVLIALGAISTIMRNAAWKNNFTLFQTDISTSASSAKINNALAGELLVKAETATDSLKKLSYCQQADRYLQKALSIHPLYVEAWLLQGNSLFYQSRYEEAIRSFQRSLEISPGYENSMGNLHLAYREGGKHWGEKMHRLDKALEYLNEAYKLKPDDFETLRLLGVAHGVDNNSVKAIEFLEKARTIKPENASVLYNLGSAYRNSGNPEKGKEYYDKARLLDSTMVNK